jgi:hypothetical protein
MLNCKKLLSMALACAMAASLAVPAFAATESTSNRSLKVTAAYQAVTINVVVPTTGTVIIDPYSLPVVVGTDDSDGDITAKNQQIITKALAIKNQSDIELKVNVATTTALTGNLKLATSADSITDSTTTNTAYIWLNFQKSGLEGDMDTVSDTAIAMCYHDAYDDDDKNFDWTSATYAEANEGKSQTILKSGAQTLKEGIVLDAATYQDKEFSAYNEGSIWFIKFDGKCVVEPKTAWTTKDGLTCTMAFTFTPNTTSSDGADASQQNP